MKGIRHLLSFLTLLTAGALLPASGASPSLTVEKVLGDPAFRHSSTLIDIVPLPDGKRVITSGQDGSARLWDLESGEELCRYVHRSRGYIWDICLMPGGDGFLTTSHTGRVIQWDLKSGKQKTICSLTNKIFSSALSPDGRFLAVAGEKECVIWDLEKRKQHSSFGVDDNQESYAVEFINDGKMVIAGFDDNGAIVKKLDDMSTVFELPKTCDGVYRIILSPDGSKLLACTAKRGLICLDTRTFRIEWEALPDRPSMYAAAWSPDQKRVAVSYHGGEGNARRYLMSILDSATGKIIRDVPIHQRNSHYGMAFSADGKHVLCSSGNTLCKVDPESGKRIFPVTGRPFRNEGVEWVAHPPSLDSILVQYEGSGLLMLDPESGDEEGIWHKETDFDSLAISASAKVLAGSLSSPSSVRIIDFKSDRTVASIDTSNSAHSLALANSGRILVVATYQGISLYAVPSGDLIEGPGNLRDADADHTASQLSGPLLAFSEKAHIRVIDTRENAAVGSMSIPETVNGLAFYPSDGPAILAAAGTNLYLWSPPAEAKAPASERRLRKAIARLGSRRFRDREDAMQYIIDQGASSLDALKDADTNDPEIRDRVGRIRKSIVSGSTYGQSTHVLPTRFTSFASLACHPEHPYWFALSGHPSDTTLIMGDIKDNKIRILSEVRDSNNPQCITFGSGNTILTGNRNGTISRYRLKID